MLRDCACHAATHLLRQHGPSTAALMHTTHDAIVKDAFLQILAPPPDTPPAAIDRAFELACLPANMAGLGLHSAITGADAAYLGCQLGALVSAKAVLPLISELDITTAAQPSIIELRNAHTRITTAQQLLKVTYDTSGYVGPTGV